MPDQRQPISISPRRFPQPWTTVDTPGGFLVKDASGFPVAYVYGDDRRLGVNDDRMTKDQARRIALAIARLPELLQTHRAPLK